MGRGRHNGSTKSGNASGRGAVQATCVLGCMVCESVDTGPAVNFRYVETSANDDTEERVYDVKGCKIR